MSQVFSANGFRELRFAWALLAEFDELLQAMGQPYYPRRFRSFVMPSAVA